MDTSTTSNASAAGVPWYSLFPEICLLVLECILPKNEHGETTVDRGFPKASSLAVVSHEWRRFFEKTTFRRIALACSDLPEFSKAVSGENSIRLNYIDRLRFYIRLARYTGCLFDKPESADNIKWNNQAFTRAMEDDDAFLTGLQSHLMPNLPIGVRSFSLIQMKILAHRYQATHGIVGPLLQLMAKSCHRFANFCPPLELNAKTFFKQLILEAKHGRSKLECLTLRAASLRPSTSQQLVTTLLIAAGRAANKLPRRRVIELWNSGQGYGYLFRYAQKDHRATITWRSSGQDFELAPQVIRVWSKVARSLTLVVEKSPFTEDEVGSEGFKHNTILSHLALRRLIFDPITEAQWMVMTKP
ncbi:hypothetical protein NCS52_00948700 [Fusarium sp. LHS14.1]|nr:hypothetical protein NCS52_00948700 [Fusarium sp. LHS14.1]